MYTVIGGTMATCECCQGKTIHEQQSIVVRDQTIHVDRGIVPLVEYINSLDPEVRTIESCEGDGNIKAYVAVASPDKRKAQTILEELNGSVSSNPEKQHFLCDMKNDEYVAVIYWSYRKTGAVTRRFQAAMRRRGAQ